LRLLLGGRSWHIMMDRLILMAEGYARLDPTTPEYVPPIHIQYTMHVGWNFVNASDGQIIRILSWMQPDGVLSGPLPAADDDVKRYI